MFSVPRRHHRARKRAYDIEISLICHGHSHSLLAGAGSACDRFSLESLLTGCSSSGELSQ